MEYVLEMNGITKRYGDNTVLDNVTLKVKPGEIHALLGENGAGKSTLMNILFGMPGIFSTGGFGGEIKIDGEHAAITSPMRAMELGIGMVHQEFMLIPGFTVTENIKLNREVTKPNLVSKVLGKDLEVLDFKTMRSDAKKALESVGIGIDELTKVSTLPVGYMQFVEIAREIDKSNMKLMVFDEPTAVLTESEAAQLIKVMKDISAKGIAIIFITHRLEEVMNAADNITILRDGKLVATRKNEETDVMELAALMIGRAGDSSLNIEKREMETNNEVIFETEDLYVDMPGESVKGLSVQVHKGEFFGIGGLAGQGKVGMPNGVMGLYPARGKVKFMGKELPLNDAKTVLKSGIASVSENRRSVGLLLDQSIEDNIVFSAMEINNDFCSGPKFMRIKNSRKVREFAKKMIKELDIRCFSPTQAAGTLSGGNQQKVCVARALALNPKFLFVMEPTRGIDIGAKHLVLETLVKLNREQGITIVMVSSELNELRGVCDRIAVVSEGTISEILKPTASDASFGLAMSGIKVTERSDLA